MKDLLKKAFDKAEEALDQAEGKVDDAMANPKGADSEAIVTGIAGTYAKSGIEGGKKLLKKARKNLE